MKILHTADLHLGKRLNKASRLDEQYDVLREIASVCDSEDVDVVLIAGDIFDATVPPSDAENLFYRALLTLSERGRAVIALAGNHDDERRMCAAKPLAELQGIVLAGELDYSALGEQTFSEPVPPASLLEVAAAADYLKKQRITVKGRNGGVTVFKGEEKTNIALVPYPSEARLRRWAEQDYTKPYAERVQSVLEKACEFFDDGYNILCTHLFLTRAQSQEPLGGLMALPCDILPVSADYVALGHVHKRMQASKKPFALYSGSPLQYAYDESRNKSVEIIDTQKRTVSEVVLSSGRKLTETEADSYNDCIAQLDFYKNDYVRIKYGGEPLGKTDVAAIKAHPAFNDLTVTASPRAVIRTERRAHLSDGEIFELYYKSRYGQDAPSALKSVFAELMQEVRENETR